MKNLRDKSVAEVEDPPENLPQLDGKEDRNETDEDNDEEYQSEQVSEMEIVKGALDKYILSLDPETLKPACKRNIRFKDGCEQYYKEASAKRIVYLCQWLAK